MNLLNLLCALLLRKKMLQFGLKLAASIYVVPFSTNKIAEHLWSWWNVSQSRFKLEKKKQLIGFRECLCSLSKDFNWFNPTQLVASHPKKNFIWTFTLWCYENAAEVQFCFVLFRTDFHWLLSNNAVYYYVWIFTLNIQTPTARACYNLFQTLWHLFWS